MLPMQQRQYGSFSGPVIAVKMESTFLVKLRWTFVDGQDILIDALINCTLVDGNFIMSNQTPKLGHCYHISFCVNNACCHDFKIMHTFAKKIIFHDPT
jgi:hypothetical protein